MKASVCNPDEAAPEALLQAVAFGMRLGELSQAEADCVVAAEDCYAYFICLGYDPDLTACEFDQTFPHRCADGAERRCFRLPNGERIEYRIECAAYSADSRCMPEDPGGACGTGACDWESFEPRCEGSEAVTCLGGLERREDCSQRGLFCVVGQDDEGRPFPHCGARAEDPCSGPVRSGGYCEGGRYYGCRLGEYRPDATSFGFDCELVHPDLRCVETPVPDDPRLRSVANCALPDGGAASRRWVTSRCEGDTLLLCAGERCRRLDCGSFLGATCEERGEEGGKARCISPAWQAGDRF